MATTYKSFSNNDVVSTKTLLNEAIPLTGTVVSGTYMEGTSEVNIKNYSHGMFQSVYDYPYLSSSANHIFDITTGYSPTSALSGTSNVQNAKKINVYNQMAKVLVGHDTTGSVREFDEDGNLAGGVKVTEAFFLNFARLLTKDEIKKGSFSVELGVEMALSGAMHKRIKLTDYNAQNDYRVNSPAGDYAVLYAETSFDGSGSAKFLKNEYGDTRVKAGLLYYQAGVAVISASVFGHASSSIPTGKGLDGGGGLLGGDYGDGNETSAHTWFPHMGPNLGGSVTSNQQQAHRSVDAMLTGSEISSSCDALRGRLYNVSFNNTTELNSTIYFCRVNHNEFNYSSNPTYVNGSKIRVKNVTSDSPVAYITGIGLYSSTNELMAVAKLSEPLKKDPTNELTLRVRLDY
jgi:hypothetical protein